MERCRRVVQYVSAFLANSYLLFPWGSPLYRGALKKICFPGLNCHSCPAAAMACPLGGIQNALAAARMNVQLGQWQFGAYVAGSLGVAGSIMGRLPCGWLCPFGLLQEWIYRLPVPKHSLWRPLRWGPYFFLAVFVVLLPLLVRDSAGYGAVWFCKYVCPAGTLEAGLTLPLLESGLRRALGWLYLHKVLVLALFLGWAAVTTRAFCRSVCPLGAIFGLFNRVSWLRLRFDSDQCVACNACLTVCPTEVSFYNGLDDINSGSCIRCLRCYSVCPAGAVTVEFGPARAPEGGTGSPGGRTTV